MTSDDQGDRNLRTLLEQHWLHCRHLESERAWFMSVYAAIIGGVLAFLADKGFKEGEWAIYFLMWITIIGLLLTIRWSSAFEVHRKRVNKIVRELHFRIKDRKGKEMDMKIPAGLFFRLVRTRRLFYAFYSVVFAGLVILRVILAIS